MMDSNKRSAFFHFASLACVVHCIVTPLIVLAAPFIGHFFENLLLEISLLVISIICGVVIVYNGYCRHKKKHILPLFSIGAILWIAHSVFEFKEIFGAKIYLTIGTILVILTYYLNHRYLKCCPAEHSAN